MLLPHVRDITVAEAYDGRHRTRRRTAHGDRPWVVLVMISSADGAVALDGSSGALGSAADQAVFSHLHRSADSVLVGAETVRRDVYSPLPDRQHLYVMSRRGDLGPQGSDLLRAGNTTIVSGDVREVVPRIEGEVCALEGGPQLNGQMLAAGLVDEVCVTVAPRLLAGDSPRMAHGPWADRAPWHLAHVCEDEGFLFLRYLR